MRLNEECASTVTGEQMKEALNQLLIQSLIVMQTLAGTSDIVFVPVEEREASLLSQMSDNERIVYLQIKAAENRGIWMKELLNRTNLHRAVVLKVVRTLEQHNVIKSVKSIKNPSKKIYMLYELQPSVDLTGGNWFTDQELDVSMVEIVSKVVVKFVSDMCDGDTATTGESSSLLKPSSFRYPSAELILQYINEKQFLVQDLDLSDVKQLLNMLVFSRKLERLRDGGYRLDPRSVVQSDFADNNNASYTSAVYTAPHNTLPLQSELYRINYWTEMPCGNCPVIDQCADIGKITPQRCRYYDDWLSF